MGAETGYLSLGKSHCSSRIEDSDLEQNIKLYDLKRSLSTKISMILDRKYLKINYLRCVAFGNCNYWLSTFSQ